MTAWYVQTVAPMTDSSAPEWGDQLSSGDGSEGSPYGSLRELIDNTTLSDGDTIYIDTETSGYPCYGSHTIAGVSNLTITRKPGLTGVQRLVNGYPIFLDTSESTDGTYDVYRTFTGVLTALPNRVSQNWNTNINAKGQRYGVLEPQASAVALKTTYGYFYDTGTDTLYISVPDGEAVGGYEHIVGLNEHTLLINNCPNCTCTYISAEHAFDPADTKGYGIRFDGTSTGGLIRYCESDGTAYHGLGTVADNPTGFRLLNNRCKTAKPDCDSQLIIFVGATGGQVSGCEIAYNTVDLDQWLGWDASSVLYDSSGIVGIACHTTATATDTAVGGLKIHHNTTTWSGGNPTAFVPDMMFVAPNTMHGGRPSDITDIETFKVQSYNNNWNGMGCIIGGGSGNETWLGSYHDSWNLQTADSTTTSGTTGFIGSTEGATSDNGIVMIACTISGDMYKSSAKAIIHVGAKFFMTNCSLHARGTGHNASSRIINFSASATEGGFEGCIFSCEQSGLRLSTGSWLGIWANAAAAAAGWNDNWYDPDFAIQFNNTTGNNRTIFQSTIDPDGEYTQAIVYADGDTSITLEPDTATAALKNTTKPEGPNGINLGAGLYGVYDETYGAWQYGLAPLSGNRSRDRGRGR